ncbi:ABC transporter ATP-binding protein [Bacillus sp. RAR_GA_16]|uniref:ABC transporter ATP-binding protein n=1 Tax=Bacillus sp. RAR_GA_16 TaxID=2876774 RepID=UPI001CCD3CCB|nr:ATP-binding cassette domain-containing protein [Bacillus sp. RAR_GA_16]MCA0171228.1 ATP-binding cassette domain-containing protein [Bacillus sp. RAR_GA_16]
MIQIDNIKHTRKQFALSIPELDLGKGITILVGKNGSGKSTLLQLIATALKPQRGTIKYGGKTIDDGLPFIRKNIGFLPTGIELYEEMKVNRFLRYMSELKGGVNEEAVEQTIVALHLQDVKRVKIKTLSQGMKQRVGIAQAILNCPPILLLDEPLNYLDSRERKNVVSLLSRYAKTRLVLIATHELNEWEDLADDVIWLQEGKVMFSGSSPLWKSRLPLRVWQGQILLSQITALDSERVIHMKRGQEHYFIKYINSSKPFAHFKEAEVTIEDAYFIRKKSRDWGIITH